MRYRNKSISISRVNVDFKGIVEPLCSSCRTRDCTHAIETKKASVFGVIRTWRLMTKGTDSLAVISCEGYSK
jgi:hypothetical protein